MLPSSLFELRSRPSEEKYHSCSWMCGVFSLEKHDLQLYSSANSVVVYQRSRWQAVHLNFSPTRNTFESTALLKSLSTCSPFGGCVAGVPYSLKSFSAFITARLTCFTLRRSPLPISSSVSRIAEF